MVITPFVSACTPPINVDTLPANMELKTANCYDVTATGCEVRCKALAGDSSNIKPVALPSATNFKMIVAAPKLTWEYHYSTDSGSAYTKSDLATLG